MDYNNIEKFMLKNSKKVNENWYPKHKSIDYTLWLNHELLWNLVEEESSESYTRAAHLFQVQLLYLY